MANFSLDHDQRTEFDRAGMLRLAGYFPAALMAQLAARIWGDMNRRYGVVRADRETWTVERPFQFRPLVDSGAFDELALGLMALAEAFHGEGMWERPRHLCLPLVTFPSGHWELPHSVWHLDFPVSNAEEMLGTIRTFVLLEPVEPKGGGTCYVAGAHRVAAALAREAGEVLRSRKVKQKLGREPWFAQLFSEKAIADREQHFMHEAASVRGVDVQVRETVGGAGDVYLMHPAMLHTVATNGRDNPRMMLVESLRSRSAKQ